MAVAFIDILEKTTDDEELTRYESNILYAVYKNTYKLIP